MFAVNALLTRQAILQSVNASLMAADEGEGACLVRIVENLEAAVHCWDKYVPAGNENVYLVTPRKIERDRLRLFPDAEADDAALRSWLRDARNAERLYRFGYLNLGLSELATLEDFQQHFTAWRRRAD